MNNAYLYTNSVHKIKLVAITLVYRVYES